MEDLDSQEVASRPRKIKFTSEDDLMLLKEVAAENPFEDGSKWRVVAEKMKRIISKAFTARNLRERVNYLLQRYELHFEEWKVASGKDEATLERISLLQEVRDMKQEFHGKRAKKGQQLASQTGKMLRDEAAKNHGLRTETVETLMVDLHDDEFIVDFPILDEIEVDEGSSPNQPSRPGSPLPPPPTVSQSPQTPSLSQASEALVGNSISIATTSNDPGTQTPAAARFMKRKRGMNSSVESFMAKKQDMETSLKRRQLDLEERKFEEEARRKKIELEIEEKKINLQLAMFHHQVKRDEETQKQIRQLLERQEDMFCRLFKSIEELVKK
ncbi:hypothetical protein GE061_014372 [Apolygus lucorum]|uniref:Myb/SANT-like DNA-binding domain-containing protein n=1 Tax=Apolygus lucorum TaxID=248454 RepID=A0A6A4JXA8_APOLU|nr:hypothetical protein GE061_014372 [Apolygus lucorum]